MANGNVQAPQGPPTDENPYRQAARLQAPQDENPYRQAQQATDENPYRKQQQPAAQQPADSLAGGAAPFSHESWRTKLLGGALGAAESIVPAVGSPLHTAEAMGKGLVDFIKGGPLGAFRSGQEVGHRMQAGDPRAWGQGLAAIGGAALGVREVMPEAPTAADAMRRAAERTRSTIPEATAEPRPLEGGEAVPLSKGPPGTPSGMRSRAIDRINRMAPDEARTFAEDVAQRRATLRGDVPVPKFSSQLDLFQHEPPGGVEPPAEQLPLFPLGGRLNPQPLSYGTPPPEPPTALAAMGRARDASMARGEGAPPPGGGVNTAERVPPTPTPTETTSSATAATVAGRKRGQLPTNFETMSSEEARSTALQLRDQLRAQGATGRARPPEALPTQVPSPAEAPRTPHQDVADAVKAVGRNAFKQALYGLVGGPEGWARLDDAGQQRALHGAALQTLGKSFDRPGWEQEVPGAPQGLMQPQSELESSIYTAPKGAAEAPAGDIEAQQRAEAEQRIREEQARMDERKARERLEPTPGAPLSESGRPYGMEVKGPQRPWQPSPEVAAEMAREERRAVPREPEQVQPPVDQSYRDDLGHRLAQGNHLPLFRQMVREMLAKHPEATLEERNAIEESVARNILGDDRPTAPVGRPPVPPPSPESEAMMGPRRAAEPWREGEPTTASLLAPPKGEGLRGIAEREAAAEEAVQPAPLKHIAGEHGEFGGTRSILDFPGGRVEVQPIAPGSDTYMYRGTFGVGTTPEGGAGMTFTPELQRSIEAALMEANPAIKQFVPPDPPPPGGQSFGTWQQTKFAPARTIKAGLAKTIAEGKPGPEEFKVEGLPRKQTQYYHSPLAEKATDALRNAARKSGYRYHVIDDVKRQNILDSFKQRDLASATAIRMSPDKPLIYDAKADRLALASKIRDIPGKLPPKGGTLLYSNPLADPAAWKMALEPVMSLYNKVRDTFDVLRYPEARMTAQTLSEGFAKRALLVDNFKQNISRFFEHAFDMMTKDQRFDFMHRYERGLPQANPALEAAARAIDYTSKLSRDMVQRMDPTKLNRFIVNYLPHLFKDPAYVRNIFQQIAAIREAGGKVTPEQIEALRARMKSDSPLTPNQVLERVGQRGMRLAGSASFLRHREVPFTMAELHDVFGIEPRSSNPMELARLGYEQSMKYITGRQAYQALIDKGLVKMLASPEEAPIGHSAVDPEIAGVPIEDKPTTQVTARRYAYAPQIVNNVLRRAVDPGIQWNPIYRGAQRSAAYLNQVSLGLSGYHAMSETELAMATSLANGDILGTATAPGRMTLEGMRLQRMAMDPRLLEQDFKDWPQPVKDVVFAGGRFLQPEMFRSGVRAGFQRAMAEGHYLSAAWRAPLALIDTYAMPVMEQYVPKLKLGAFQETFRQGLNEFTERTGNMPSDAEYRQLAFDTWRQIDNRFGQVVYENWFWPKAVQQMGFLGLRALGWSVGNLRLLGGSAVDLAKFGKDVVTPGATASLGRAKFMLAFSGIWAAYHGLMTYLNTGQAPQDMKDYVAYRTGRSNPDGTPERKWLAGVGRDVYAWVNKPSYRVALSKLNPLVDDAFSVWTNKDWMGNMVYNPDDPYVKQGEQVAQFLGKQTVPISIRQMQQQEKEGGSLLSGLGAFVGTAGAPAALSRTPAENQAAFVLSKHGKPWRTPEETERFGERKDIQETYRRDPGRGAKMAADALAKGDISVTQFNNIFRQGRGLLANAMQSATLDEATTILERANADERRALLPLYIAKWGRAPAQDQQRTLPLLRRPLR